MGVKILSLYDGMACGMIAMLLAGVPVESYDAYEIDKYAIKVATHNFPNIKEHGDVFEADFTQYEGVDFLVGGSPCTYWSIAQTKNRETVASGMGWELFSQYVRALKESKPKYFIYENNKSMSKQIRASIDDAFGFEAICINSALVSAQNRQRLYWVGKRNADGTYSRVNVEQPADRGILLKDVLDSEVAWKPMEQELQTVFNKDGGVVGILNMKAQDAIKRVYGYNGKAPTLTTCGGGHREPKIFSMVAEPVCVAERGRMYCGQPQHYEARTDGKTNTLTSVEKDNRVAEPISYCTDKNIEHLMRNFGSKGKIVDEESKTPTLMAAAGMGGGNHIYYADLFAEPINMTTDGKAQCLRATCYKDGIRNIIANEVDKKTGVAEPINVTADDKAHTLKAQYYKNGIANFVSDDGFDATAVAEPVCLRYERTEEAKRCRKAYEAHEIKHGYNELNELHPRPDGKTNTLTTVLKDNQIMESIPTMPVKEATARGYTEIECGECVDLSMPNSKTRRGRSMADKANCMQTSNEFYQYVGYAIEFDDDGRPIKAIGKDGKEITIYEVKDGKITIKGKQYPIKLKDGYYIIRKLTVSECKRLQTVPEWYEFPVSNSQAYKMLGNGWTCEVIAHLIRSCLLRADEIKADYERGHITVSDGGSIQGVFDMGVLEYVYMTEPRKEQE